MSETRLIVGLGNPGKEYQWTRHNLGFLVLEKLAQQLGFSFKLSSFTNGLTASVHYNGFDLFFLMPLTFMNNSGAAVKPMFNHLRLELPQVLVVCDDFQLDFGQLRLRGRGRDGGHNGLSSIIHSLQTEEFCRLRMGIGAPPDKSEVVEYVLNNFSKTENEELKNFISRAADCCLSWAEDGLVKAMEGYNRKS